MQNMPFLATTALEEFWDRSRNIVFLGEECCRYSRRWSWEPLNGTILPSPWDDPLKTSEADRYCREIYEKYLVKLSGFLNQAHDEDHSPRYWRIVIGPWLHAFTIIAKERYTTITDAFSRLGDFDTYVLDESCYQIPKDTLEARVNGLNDDLYNLQIYSRIFSVLGKSFASKKPQDRLPNDAIKPAISWKANFKSGIGFFSNSLAGLLSAKDSIFLTSSYLPLTGEIKLLLKSKGKILPLIRSQGPSPENTSLDMKMRVGFRSFCDKETIFDDIFCRLLCSEIPRAFLENYSFFKIQSEKFPETPRAIFSANAWYFDEPFKMWAASSAEKGTLLLGTQHGGNYGSIKDLSILDHELSICDRYYSWGWSAYHNENRTPIRPMPATKLNCKEFSADKKKKDIVLGTNVAGRFRKTFDFFGKMMTRQYFEDQILFAQSLGDVLFMNLRVRLYQNDYGWDAEEMWKERVPNVRLERMGEVSFASSLKNCRIYVCDHLSTTFIEALSANKPTILFWDPAKTLLTEEAQPYYDALNRVGILHYSPKDAADKVNEIYENVEKWWNGDSLQKVLKEFCRHFAMTSDNALEEWNNEFSSIIKHGV